MRYSQTLFRMCLVGMAIIGASSRELVGGSCTGYESCKNLGDDATLSNNACTGYKSCEDAGKGGTVIIGPNACTSSQSCNNLAESGGIATLAKKACTGNKSCEDAAKSNGKIIIGEESCTQTRSCDEAARNYGDITIGKKSCTGNKSCDDLGNNQGKATVANESCTQTQSCEDAAMSSGEATIGNKSCTGNKSCFELGNKGKATVANESCTQTSSCEHAALDNGEATVGYKSCTGNESCKNLGRTSGKAVTGERSCTANQSCLDAGNRGDAKIGARSCTGNRACKDFGETGTGVVGEGSCTANQSCDDGGDGGSITIGDNSCTENKACYGLNTGTFIIGNNSCTCSECCSCLKDGDIIPDNKCKKYGDCCIGNNRQESVLAAFKAQAEAGGTCASQDNSPAIADVTMTNDSCKARGWGDPHMVTWDGLRYDVHVHGELIFAKSTNPNSSFQIQGRTEPVKNHPAKPAVTTGVVITDDGVPKIQVSMPRDTDEPCTEVIRGCPVDLYVDDVLRKPSHGSGSSLAKVDVSGKRITIQYPSTSLKVVMDVNNWRNECHFSVSYIFGTCPSDLIGILGSPDGEWRNDWMDTSGNQLTIPSNLRRGSGFRPTFEYAQNNWCIPNEAASNFAYEHDTSFAFFDICDNPNVDQLAVAVENADEDVKKRCHYDVFCVLDTVAFAAANDETAIEAVIGEFNADEGLHHELKQTERADIEIIEQVPDDLGNANCPTCKAVGWGDPHIVTFDGLPYDVHVKGELTLLKSTDPANDFTIQARTVAVKNHPKGPAVTTGVVVHEDSRLGLPDVQVSLGQAKSSTFGPEEDGYCVKANGADQNSGVIKVLTGDYGNTNESKELCLEECSKHQEATGCEMIWDQGNKGCYVHTQEVARGNGVNRHFCYITATQGANSELATEFTTGRGDKCYVQLFVDKEAKSILGGTGTTAASVQVNGNRVVVEYPTTNLKLDIRVTSWRQECHFSVDYYLVDCRCDETLVGILGQPDSDKDWRNDWHEHDGTPVPIPSRRSDRRGKKAYEYSRTWCINAMESMFAYETGMTHADFDECLGTKGDDNFEIDVGAIIEGFEDTDPAVITQCTMDGDDEPDEGCLVDCFFGGEDACNEFTDTVAAVVADTAIANIIFPPEPEITLQVPETAPAGGGCPVCKAVGWGDPHIITFDGVSYDVHVKGELTFLKSIDPQNDFTIQARTAIVANHPRGPAVTTGVLVHETGQPTIQVSLGQSPNSANATMFGQCPVQLFVNGVAMDIDAGTGLTDATVQVKGKRIVVEYINTQMRLDMSVKVWRNTCHFSVTYYLADCPCDGSLVGILGQPDGDWSNDWHHKNGTAVGIPTSRRDRRGKKAYDYSVTWCLMDADSHFTYEPNMSHDDHDFCTGNKGDNNYDIDIDEIVQETNNTNPTVITKCTMDGELDEGCVLDCALLGDEACDEFIDIVQNTTTANITDAANVVTEDPTSGPTSAPTSGPTSLPTSGPTSLPTNGPTSLPTNGPTSAPTNGPTESDPPPAGTGGDPHVTTWANEHYEYHGQCDLVLAKDANFAGGLGLEIHIRTKVVRYWSYIKSVAIKIGNDILEIEGSADANDAEAHYWMNFEYQGELETFAGFPVTQKLPSIYKRSYIMDLSPKFPGKFIAVELYKEFVRVRFNGNEQAFGNTVGLMGDYKTGKTFARDGTTVMDDFTEFGDEWQVLPSEPKIFHEISHPQFPELCIKPEDPRGERKRRLEESTISIEQAEAACASLKDPLSIKDCVYDIMATQDLDMVGAF